MSGEAWGAAANAVVQGVGNRRNTNLQSRVAADTDNLNRELAESGIRMRVKDAQKAGISPLAALGLPLSNPSPVSVTPSDYSGMGQSIERAIVAASSSGERETQKQMAQLGVENAQLQNDLLRTDLQLKRSAQVGPALPSPMDNPDAVSLGQGDAVKITPARVVASQPGQPSKEAGAITDVGYSRTEHGYAVVPSQDVKNRIEDQIVPEFAYALRNYLPRAGMQEPPAHLKASLIPRGANPADYVWKYNPLRTEWYVQKKLPRAKYLPRWIERLD